jgi:hypothetical protein
MIDRPRNDESRLEAAQVVDAFRLLMVRSIWLFESSMPK